MQGPVALGEGALMEESNIIKDKGCIIGAGTETTLHGGGSLQLVVPHLSRMRSRGESG